MTKPLVDIKFEYNQDGSELYLNIEEFEHPNRKNRTSHIQVQLKGTQVIEFIRSVVIGRREVHSKFN